MYLKLLNLILFADDTNLFRSGRDINSLCKEVSKELDKLKIWFRVNKLSLNVLKTNFILFSGRKCISNVSIAIDNESIDRVFSTKFLGVYIDDKLSWKQHASIVKSKLCKCLSVFYKCNLFLETESLKTLYCTLFLPHLSYCCEIWGSASKKVINPIEILQKRVLRITCKESKYTHSSPLFLRLYLLKFKDLVNFNVAQIMYKAYHSQLPETMQKNFELTNTGKYSLRNINKFKIRFVRTTLKHNCLSIHGVKLFNSLPHEISSIPTLLRFKKKYKHHLISQYV